MFMQKTCRNSDKWIRESHQSKRVVVGWECYLCARIEYGYGLMYYCDGDVSCRKGFEEWEENLV